MNRSRVPRQHRRFSLPATSTLSPFGLTRSFPEGSDIFQKAFEDLCLNEPNHAPTKSDNYLGFNGLTNIQEGNESDTGESEEQDSTLDGLEPPSRRHSSPSCFRDQFDSDLRGISKQDNKEKPDSVIKTHIKLRKEYFIKNGHWPASKPLHSLQKQQPFSYHKDKTKPGLAFGSKVSK